MFAFYFKWSLFRTFPVFPHTGPQWWIDHFWLLLCYLPWCLIVCWHMATMSQSGRLNRVMLNIFTVKSAKKSHILIKSALIQSNTLFPSIGTFHLYPFKTMLDHCHPKSQFAKLRPMYLDHRNKNGFMDGVDESLHPWFEKIPKETWLRKQFKPELKCPGIILNPHSLLTQNEHAKLVQSPLSKKVDTCKNHVEFGNMALYWELPAFPRAHVGTTKSWGCTGSLFLVYMHEKSR